MKPSLRLALGLLLALSLGLKLLGPAGGPAADPTAFPVAAAAMLRAAGLSVSLERRPFADLVRGSRGACRVVVAEDDPHGTFAEGLRRVAAPLGPLHFAWRGRLYDQSPRRRALIHFYLRRELARIGMAPPRQPIAAWAASPGCRGLRVDWRRLAALPG